MSDQDPISLVACIAGNLLSGKLTAWWGNKDFMQVAATEAVAMARLIVAEAKRTQPVDPSA